MTVKEIKKVIFTTAKMNAVPENQWEIARNINMMLTSMHVNKMISYEDQYILERYNYQVIMTAVNVFRGVYDEKELTKFSKRF